MKIDFDEVNEALEKGNLAEISRETGIAYRTLQDWKLGNNDWLRQAEKRLSAIQIYIEERKKMKFESVNSIIFDKANNWYEIELMTEDNKLAYIRVDADDHPEAESDEHYFDDKELIEKIIDEALEDGEVIYE